MTFILGLEKSALKKKRNQDFIRAEGLISAVSLLRSASGLLTALLEREAFKRMGLVIYERFAREKQ